MDPLDNFLNTPPSVRAIADEFDRRATEIVQLRAARDAAEAERIALADAFRETLVRAGFEPTTAALLVQAVIDRAAAKHQEAIRNGR